MSEAIEEYKHFGEAFKKKTTSFLLLGILLMSASMYINVLKAPTGDIGIFYSEIIIKLTIAMQIILWVIYLFREKRKLFDKKEKKQELVSTVIFSIR
ncbi:MAG: hypothetical protein OIN84_21140 [Candidatus Methanoperedens sp.]|uniref:hypothetical protein n=1 Tax=Candidatus Methanoperedens sp. BLZ2 TaxID=2035255 RepID=UPI000BE2CC13|nr:hypothetical protein [Candidatus Methanoperedens sp. BLZ2]KAB2946958.1 MAG: hypothetical protein F9K14_05845 [Candidatus Methanoperedens sp.]MBZ0176758.1 hypothetical protein [Candidatus Methanoperedens nitroreducens]MCX9080479.1 hypothetical protein [Candidatus Methanoperedens sp.]